MGYVMAQDRLWQMDLFRRASAGRLSEIFGKVTLDADRFARVLGFRRDSVGLSDALSPEEKAYLDSFVKGINAYMDIHPGRLPVEFDVLGYGPDPFTVTDILTLSHFQSYASNHNWKFEMLRASAIQELGELKGRELVPAVTFHGPYTALPGSHGHSEGIPGIREFPSAAKHGEHHYHRPVLARLLRADAMFRQISGLQGNQIHSNFWIVSGKHSKSGKPILSNDYHMPFLLPSLWYLVHLAGDGIDAVGITMPGLPTIVAGHNRHIAWGATTNGADTQDLYQEKLNPDNSNEYLYEDAYFPFEVVNEEIGYKSEGKLEKETLTVKISRHGPLINSISENKDDWSQPLSLQSVEGAAEGQVAFSMAMYRASNWQEFKRSVAHVRTPVWNWGYADSQGNIGYKLNGTIPIRSRGNGLEPVPGWSGDYEWEGTIPFSELPEVYNPATGYIVSANNEVVDSRYPHVLAGSIFQLPYRAIRIEELLNDRREMSQQTMRNIQADTRSLFGLNLSRYIVEAVDRADFKDERTAELTEILRSWDGTTDVDSIASSVVQEFLIKLMDNTIANKVSEELYQHLLKSGKLNYVSSVVLLMMHDASLEHWFDDPKTQLVEDRTRTIIQSLTEADESLREALGDDISNWRWGRIHQTYFQHQMGSMAPFKWLWNIGPAEFPGDISTISPGTYTDISQKPYRAVHGASMRHIVDFGDVDGSDLVITTGQSGQWLSPHYDDQAELWHGSRYLKISMDREAIEKDSIGRTMLVPSE